MVVGTHALFQDQVVFKKLGLVIVDEQHRFGVHQRLSLKEKGIEADAHPHQIVMTATPIPRTLAMSVYADLDTSIIDELPPGRTPVSTLAMTDDKRATLIKRLDHACREERRQAYWVCTLIEESENLQAQAAEKTYDLLTTELPQLAVGLIHGRMKSQDKSDVMAHFKAGKIDILVATTVIEVGVDVPNASLMVIENAERLGLAQLHQLRGRVGRGATASHCILLYHPPLSNHGEQRIAVMRESNDGFVIAEKDLALRGPGEVLGTRQTGVASFRIADLYRDRDHLPRVHQMASQLVAENWQHNKTLVRRWLGMKEQYAKV
jgi:ATP-dependent DNA helicase RecG